VKVDRLTDIQLTGTRLTRADVVAVARGDATAGLSSEAREAMNRSRQIVEKLAASGEPAYGISTGFGALADKFIPEDRRSELQRNLIRSHSAGMGPRVEREVVRAMVLLRARTLAMGFSGLRPAVVDRMLDMLNAGITPAVHEYGSLGASGDLAPLAHVALTLLGEGTVEVGGVDQDASAALATLGWEALELEAKEGLALINGTDGIQGMLVLALADLETLLTTADITAAMSVVRRRHHRDAPPARSGDLRRQHDAGTRRVAHRCFAPPRRSSGPGRLLAAVFAAGQWRGP
jgi:histidine ammonia-lyase